MELVTSIMLCISAICISATYVTDFILLFYFLIKTC